MSDKLDAQISISADASGVEAGVGRAKRSLKTLSDSAREVGSGLSTMGSGSELSVKQVERNTRTMEQQLQRHIAVLQAGSKDSRKYWEQMADFRGVDKNALRPLLQQLDQLKDKQAAAAGGMTELSGSAASMGANMALAARGVQTLLGLQVVGWAKDGAAALFEASAAAERLRIGLDFASVRGSADEIAYLRKTTDGLGLAFASTAQSYMQFQAAAKGTALEGSKARDVFEAVAKASAVMGLSAEQNSGVLLALQQMVSKGTVQAEELRGQLGERLPGAFQIAARSMGVTTAELGKMLEMGQVISDDFLPKFAAELDRSLGGAAENAANRLDAAVNRFDNAWDRLKQKVGDSGVSKAMAEEMSALSREVISVTETIERASAEGSGAFSALSQGALVAAGRAGFSTLNLAANTLNGTINLLTGDLLGLNTNLALLPEALKTNAEQVKALGINIESAQAKLKRLQELDAMPSNGNYYKTAIQDTNEYIEKLREALRLRGGLSGVSTPIVGGDPYNDGSQYGAYLDKQKKFDAAQVGLLELSARTNGINKQFTADLKTYADALDAGAMSAGEYAKAVTDLNAKRYESTEAGKAEAKALRDSARDAKGSQSSYQSLAKSIQEKLVAQRQELMFGTRLTDIQKLGLKVEQELTGAKKAALLALVGIGAAQQQELDARAAFLLFAEQEKKARLDLAATAEKGAASYIEANKRLREEIELIGLSEEAQYVINRARLEAQITVKEQHLAEVLRANDVFGFMSREQIALEEQIRLLKERLGLMDDKKVRDANAKAQDRLEKEWDKTAQTIGDTLADYIMSGGKDAATYLKRLFSTLVLQPVVQTAVGSILGVGNASAGGLLGSSSGGAGSLLGGVQNLQSIYSAFSGGLVSSIAGAIGTLGSTFGSSALSSFAVGMKGSSLAAGLAGPTTAGAGGFMGAGAGFASALPWIAGGLAVVSLIGSLTKEVTPHAGAASEYRNGAASGNARTAQNLVNAGDSYVAAMQAPLNNLALIVGSSFDSLAKQYEKKSGYFVGTGFTSDNNDPSSGFFQLSNPDGESLSRWTISRKDPKYTSRGTTGYSADSAKGYDEYLKDVALASLSGIMDIVPDWADDMARSVTASLGSASGKDAMQAFSDLVEQIFAIEAAFTSLGEVMPMFVDITDGVKGTLIKISGGFDALNANAQSFYANFYTAEEKLQNRVNSLQEVFQEYGVELPTTVEQYRALVEEQMAAGDAGAEFAAILLGLNGTFKEVADVWKTELAAMASSVGDFFGDLHEQIQGLSGDVASDRKSILRGSTVMSAEAIAAAVAGTALMSPSLAGVTAAGSAADMARDLVQQRKAGANAAQGGVDGQQEKLDAAKGLRDSTAGQLSAVDARIDYLNQASARLWNGGSKSGYSLSKRKQWQRDVDAEMAVQMALRAQLQAQLQPLEGDVTQQQAVYDEFVAAAKAAAEKLAEAQKALADANKAQEQAKVDYASEVAQWVIDAEGSVSKLSDLRGEVMGFYEAQAQAVQAMLQSAGNIRGVVDQVRLSQLSPEQTAQELGARYAMDYSMALATTGSARAGYVDAMAGNLQGLSESMRAQAGSSAEWQISVGKLLAQASNAAGLLEGDAEADDYQDVALGLLGSIDTALGGLSTATKSAEQVIADAIAAGTQAQLEGLRAIVAALTGQSIPGFAVGTNYVTQDMTARIHQGEAIIPKAFNPWAGGKMPMGGGDSAAVVAQQREHREEQRAQASASVRLLQDIKRLLQDDNRILVRWEEERQENA
nr:tape measure protein [uncultured Comamonas sp.]